MQFSDLGLVAPVLKALDGEGYTVPTPIQQKAIPVVIAGSDLVGIAQTGTGKTAAFALPILTRLAAEKQPAMRKGCRVLVLSPTRELAAQIAESFRVYGRYMGVSVATIYGGVAMRPQVDVMSRGVDVLVATPGRLLDHVDSRTVDLSGTAYLVLDEADQMLDLGFVKPIRRIVSRLSHKRQNLFFSATMPREITALVNELLTNPVHVAVTPVASTAERVSQRVIHIESGKKKSLLVELLANADMGRTLVFTRTKRGADRVARHLEASGIHAAAIHGNKSQRQREIALELFRNAKIRVLVATDIAARGIDVDGVTHVVNYEMPEVPEAYVHRIGRTARAGASGLAISLCDGGERDLLRSVERLTRQSIPSEDRRGDTTIALDSTVKTDAGDDARREGGRGYGSSRHGGGAGRSGNGGARNGSGGPRRSGRGEATRGEGRDGPRPAAPRGRQERAAAVDGNNFAPRQDNRGERNGASRNGASAGREASSRDAAGRDGAGREAAGRDRFNRDRPNREAGVNAGASHAKPQRGAHAGSGDSRGGNAPHGGKPAWKSAPRRPVTA